jgi:Glucose inhibited division protein A
LARIIVIGGGWAGCSAALKAGLAGEQVLLLERTDLLLGTGLAGGIMKNNGRWTVTEEIIEMGGGEIFQVLEKVYLHRDLQFPGHSRASIYDVTKIELQMRKALQQAGVTILTKNRVKDVVLRNRAVQAVLTDQDEEITGDVFVETTGSAGPEPYCRKYGNGCAMCILRCPTFGGRVSISEKVGVKERRRISLNKRYGRLSGACNLLKDSLSEKLSQRITQYGKVEIPVPKEILSESKEFGEKSCPQYEGASYEEKLILLDNGHAKLMRPFFSLKKLRQISGLENAAYVEPISGGIGNSVRYLSLTPVDIFLKMKGAENLFCAGETIGSLAGHTEAIITGILAGHNAVLLAKKKKLFSPPPSTALGDFISYVNQRLAEAGAPLEVFTFSGSVYLDRMKKLALYRTHQEEIRTLIKGLGLTGVLQ